MVRVAAEGLVGLHGIACLLGDVVQVRYERAQWERVFSREAIAFTFTEKTVLIAALLMLGSAIDTRKISTPTGGMFSLVMNEIIWGFTPEKAGFISVVVLLSGIPASVVGGWAADKWAINV